MHAESQGLGPSSAAFPSYEQGGGLEVEHAIQDASAAGLGLVCHAKAQDPAFFFLILNSLVHYQNGGNKAYNQNEVAILAEFWDWG